MRRPSPSWPKISPQSERGPQPVLFINDGFLRVTVEELDELQEDSAGLPLGQNVGDHYHALGVLDHHAAAQGVVPEELGRAQNVLRILERHRVEGHGNGGLRSAVATRNALISERKATPLWAKMKPIR